MGVFLVFGAINPGVIEGVDTHAAAGMKDTPVVAYEPDVDDITCFILEPRPW